MQKFDFCLAHIPNRQKDAVWTCGDARKRSGECNALTFIVASVCVAAQYLDSLKTLDHIGGTRSEKAGTFLWRACWSKFLHLAHNDAVSLESLNQTLRKVPEAFGNATDIRLYATCLSPRQF